MSLESLGRKFRKNLVDREIDTRDEVLKSFQLSYRIIQEKIDANLLAVRDALARGEKISPALLFERTRLEGLLSEIGFEIDKLSVELGRTTTKAQRDAIAAATDETGQVFKVGNVASITGFDSGAIAQLSGIAGNGDPIQKLFSTLKQPLVESIKNSLITGAALGSSPEAIARDIKTALGTSTAHALTIARTETNRAYRESTRQIYEQNKNVVNGYAWVSSLDLRTCPICWAMHGRIFPTSEKFATHPNCRCTLVAVVNKKDKIEPGADQFRKLTPAQQREILGRARFDLYEQGKAGLNDFVGEKETAFGKARYIRPLSDVNLKASKTVKPPTPKPVKKASARATKKPQNTRPKTAKEAAKQLESVTTTIDNRLAAISKEQAEIMAKFSTGGYSIQDGANAMKKFQAITDERFDLEKNRRSRILDVLRVEKPTNVKLNFKSRYDKANKDRIKEAISDFNSLIDEVFLKNVEFGMIKTRTGRAFFDGQNIAGYEHITAATIVHEASHGLEMLHSPVLNQALRFYNYRTAKDKVVPLGKFGSGYRSSEKTKVDKFFSPYVGKLPYEYNGKPVATEIISMGVERYYKDPLAFSKDDPEYFEFIFKTRRGEKWIQP